MNSIDNVKTTFSSWDGCMAKVYCKWPVIAGIVIGSLIIFSIVACIARCICCGAEVACCCFRCCTCCCGGGGGRGRKSGHRRVDSDPKPNYPSPYPTPYAAPPAPPAPPIDQRPLNQQYRANPMPTFSPMPTFNPQPAPAPTRSMFATFDSPSKPANPDALPPMPTWKEARDVHVEVEEEEEPAPIPQRRGDMEMDRLNHNGSVANGSMTSMGAIAGAVPRRSPGPGRSPPNDEFNNSYNRPYAQQDNYRRGSPGPGRPYAEQDEYRRGSPGPGRPYAEQDDYRRGSPGPGRPYAQQDDYRRGSPGPGPGPGRSPVYGGGGAARGPPGGYDRQSPAPQQQKSFYPDHRDQHDTYSDPYNEHDTYTDPFHHDNDYHHEEQRSVSPLPPQHYARSPSPQYHSSPSPLHGSTTNLNTTFNNHNASAINTSASPSERYDAYADHSPTIPSYAHATEPARFAEPASPVAAAYPGQRAYNAGANSSPVYPGQQTYQAFQPR